MNAITNTTPTYAIDPAHSSVEFTVQHMVISKVRGRFSGISGTIAIPDGVAIPTGLEVTIDAASIDTREEQRDGHLKSPEFLDIAAFPTLTFKSDSISGDAKGFTIHGDLTLHGVTRSVIVRARLDGRATDPWGNDRIAFSGEAEVDRRDFGMVWNQILEAGGVLVGTRVSIEISIQAVKGR